MTATTTTTAKIGNLLHCLALIINLTMTTFALLQIPSNIYDKSWQKFGFCVDERDDRKVDTAILCFSILTAGAASLALFYQQKKITMNQLLQHRMKGFIFSNFSHGFGHLFLQYTDGMTPQLEFSFKINDIAWVVMLIFFFFGAFQAVTVSVSNQQAFLMAIGAILMQKILDVPPEMSFSYAQTVILASGFIDQLMLPSRDKQGVTYFAGSLYHYPLIILYFLEGTQCSDLVVKYGGHAIYDTYLSTAPFLFYYAIQHYGESSTRDQKYKKI